MIINWDFMLDISILGAALFFATILRSKIKILQKFMVPNNILAGFLLLAIGTGGFGLIETSSERFGNYVYHLLAIVFIAMTLRKSENKSSKSTFAMGLVMSVGTGIQTGIGLIIAYIFMQTLMPDLFPTFGYFLMLGFAQGPGQSYSLGKSWELSGFENAGDIGLTFAAVGYIWAALIGVLVIYYLKKKYYSKTHAGYTSSENQKKGVIKELKEQPSAGNLTTDTAAIDGFSFQIATVIFVYLLTFLFLKGLEKSLLSINDDSKIMHQLVNTAWGLHFIFAAFIAVLVKKIIYKLGWGNLLNNGLLTRISGVSLDFMVTASIAAISIPVVIQYTGIILTMSTIGGLFTVYFVFHEIRRSGLNHPFERIAGLFGTLTGTLSSGLTLIRILDKDFTTNAAHDQVFGAGIAAPFIAPLILSVIVPLLGMNTSNPDLYFLLTLGGIFIYISVLYFIWRRYTKVFKKKKEKPVLK
ncbi:MAG: hypothetical protein DRI94_00475 [Bacteroidetes bacterium]|nr:MAG: hypothetical protein DRI94_00475 [Bacteroidota bacterium]